MSKAEWKNRKTVNERQEKQKQDVLKRLIENPIVYTAVVKAGVSTSTYYRWRNEDEAFKENADGAILLGTDKINGMMESKIISDGLKGNTRANIYWLEHNHPKYAKKEIRVVGVVEEIANNKRRDGVIRMAIKKIMKLEKGQQRFYSEKLTKSIEQSKKIWKYFDLT